MQVQITPNPNETERKAILAALAAERKEQRANLLGGRSTPAVPDFEEPEP